KLNYIACRGCTKLASVCGVDAETVEIDNCRKVDLRTLSSERIKSLQLVNMKQIDDMGFLRNCQNLENLVLVGTRLTPSCVPQIAAVRQLKRAELYGFALKEQDLRRLSTLAKDAVITNGLKTFRRGLEVAGE